MSTEASPAESSVNAGKPDSTAPLYRCMTKGVRGPAEAFQYGLKWITARRALLKVFADRLECGDWTVPYAAFQEAELFKTRSGIIPCYILKVRTATETYQFGLNGNKYWAGNLPFEVKRTEGRLKFSAFSIVLRVALLAVLIWYAFFRGR